MLTVADREYSLTSHFATGSLYGVSVAQALFYFLSFKNDGRFLKFLVSYTLLSIITSRARSSLDAGVGCYPKVQRLHFIIPLLSHVFRLTSQRCGYSPHHIGQRSAREYVDTWAVQTNTLLSDNALVSEVTYTFSKFATETKNRTVRRQLMASIFPTRAI